MAATIERQENLFDSTKVDLSMGFGGPRIGRKGVHEELALWEVFVVVERFYGPGIKSIGRVVCEEVLTVETQTEAQDGVVRVVIGQLIGRLNDEEQFTDGVLEVQIENGRRKVGQEADGLVLALGDGVIEAGSLEPPNLGV